MSYTKDGFNKQVEELTGSDEYVLLAGGGLKPLDELSGAAHNHDTVYTKKIQAIPFVVGPSTDAAGTWTGECADIDAYYDGLSIIYIPGKAGASTTTLNINGYGAKTCYYNASTKLTTHYPVGSPILLTYYSNSWRTAEYYYDTDYLAGQYYFRYKVNANGFVGAYTIIGKCPDGTITSLTKTNNTTAATKTMYTGPLLLDQFFYYNNTTTYAANAQFAKDNTIRDNYTLVDVRYTFNCINTLTGKANQPFFIVLNKGNDGYFYLDTTQPWQAGIPDLTVASDKIYVWIGVIYPDGTPYRSTFEVVKKAYTVKDNKFVEYVDDNVNPNIYIGAQSVSGTLNNSSSTTTNGNTYLKLFKDSTLRQQYKISGSGTVSVASDANGNITITGSDTNSHYVTGLYVGATGDTKAAAQTTNGNTYIKLFDDSTLRQQYLIQGSGSVSVASDANGNITITGTDSDTHYTSNLRLGANTGTTNAAVTSNPYIKLVENNTVRDTAIQIKGAGTVTTSCNNAGVLTITGADTNTHYTTGLYIGDSTANSASAQSNPYIKLFDDSTLRQKYQLIGGSGISVDSDSNGDTTFKNTAPLYLTTDGGSTTAGTWLATNTDIETLTDGLAIIYPITVAGASTTTLNLNGSGAKTVYINGTTKLTTHYPVGQRIILIYSTVKTAWFVNEYDSNTNTLVRTYRQITNNATWNQDYPLIASRTLASGYGAADGNYKDVYGLIGATAVTPTVNPITGEVKAVKFTGEIDQYTTGFYIGAVDTNSAGETTNGNTYLKIFDSTTLRQQYKIEGGTNISVTSDSSGNITITNTMTDSDTHWTSNLRLGASGTTTNAAVTADPYIKLVENNTLRETAIQVKGTGTITTSCNNAGVLTIYGADTNSHYVTGLYVGATGNTKAAAQTTNGNTYIKLFDDNTLRQQYKIQGAGNVTVASDSSGNITITGTDSDSHWTSNLRLGAATGTTNAAVTSNPYIKLVENNTLRETVIQIKGAGTVTTSCNNAGVLTITGADTNSHYTTGLYIGATATNAAGAQSDPYIKLYDDTTERQEYQLIGGKGMDVDSDSSGNVTFTNTAPLYLTTDNGSTTAGTWLASCSDITALTDGLAIIYPITVAGAATTTLKINNLDAKTVYINSTTKLTTHYPVGQRLILTYSSSKDAWHANNYWSDSHWTTSFWVGAASTKAAGVTTNGNTYLKIYDNNTLRQQYLIQGSGTVSVESDSAGAITITGVDTSNLYIGAQSVSGTLNNSSGTTTNGNTYIKLFADSTLKQQYKITGAGNVTVASDASGNITITGSDSDSHWTSYLRLGASTGTGNAAQSNPYIKLVENNTVRATAIQVKGAGSVSVASDANGVLTITGTDTNTHNIANLYIGAKDTNSASQTTNGNTYIKLFDGGTLQNQYKITGSTGITVTSSASGDVTIANTGVNSPVRTITKSLQVTEAWMDTGIDINSTNFPDGNGTYIINITLDNLTSVYSGVVSINTNTSTATNISEEIILHRLHSSGTEKRIYLKIVSQGSGNMKLQIAANSNFSGTYSTNFKFRKII